MDDLISRQAAISHVDDVPYIKEHPNVGLLWKAWIESLPAAQPDVPDTNVGDMVSRQAAVDALDEIESEVADGYGSQYEKWRKYFCELPSAQPEQRYTEEELRVFQHGISLSLLSKRSAQHWRYDEDTATEIKFLERLYEKVGADMRGEQDDSF